MMARKKKDKGGLLLILASGAALLLLGLGKKPGGGGGAAVPGGSIGSVNVSQQTRMGSHLVSKNEGAVVSVSVGWAANTKDASGNPVNWPYFFDYIMTEISTGIVRAQGGLGQIAATSGALTFSGSFNLGGPPTGAYDVKVVLSGAASDALGHPRDGNWVHLGELTHPNAIQATGVAGMGQSA